MKKILICGGTGFIGANLVDYFSSKKQYEVHATFFKTKPAFLTSVKWHKADLRNEKTSNIITKGFDIVIQAAATTSGVKDIVNKPHIHVTDNAVMNSYLMRSAYENNVNHVIFFSCTVMYQSSNRNLKETDFNPSIELQKKYYGVGHTKLYIEKLCKFYSELGKTKYTVIRHSNIYGPHDKFDLLKSHFFGASVSKILTAKNEITIWGDGSEKRDFLYVSDLMNFVRIVIQNKKNNFDLYNCSYGKSFSVKEIINKMVKISKKKLSLNFDNSKPSIKSKMSISSNKAYKDLGWKPEIDIDKGINKTFKWWKDNFKK